MTLQEAHELIDELNFKDPGIMHQALDDVDFPGNLGFECEKQVCSICGFEQVELHPIPVKYPGECGNCGQMACYKAEIKI